VQELRSADFGTEKLRIPSFFELALGASQVACYWHWRRLCSLMLLLLGGLRVHVASGSGVCGTL
jgi:hypothetical protein